MEQIPWPRGTFFDERERHRKVITGKQRQQLELPWTPMVHTLGAKCSIRASAIQVLASYGGGERQKVALQ